MSKRRSTGFDPRGFYFWWKDYNWKIGSHQVTRQRPCSVYADLSFSTSLSRSEDPTDLFCWWKCYSTVGSHQVVMRRPRSIYADFILSTTSCQSDDWIWAHEKLKICIYEMYSDFHRLLRKDSYLPFHLTEYECSNQRVQFSNSSHDTPRGMKHTVVSFIDKQDKSAVN